MLSWALLLLAMATVTAGWLGSHALAHWGNFPAMLLGQGVSTLASLTFGMAPPRGGGLSCEWQDIQQLPWL